MLPIGRSTAATGISGENRLPGLLFLGVNVRFLRLGLTGASDIIFAASHVGVHIIFCSGYKKNRENVVIGCLSAIISWQHWLVNWPSGQFATIASHQGVKWAVAKCRGQHAPKANQEKENFNLK